MNVCIIMNNIKLQHYDKIDVPEGIHIKKQLNQKSAMFVTIGIF